MREDACNGCMEINVHLRIGKLRHVPLGDAPVLMREGNKCAGQRVGWKDSGRGEALGR